MSSFSRKIKRNKNINIKMAIKFRCAQCCFERLVPQSEFKKMTQDTFKNNKLFICDKCNIRMVPITIEVDY